MPAITTWSPGRTPNGDTGGQRSLMIPAPETGADWGRKGAPERLDQRGHHSLRSLPARVLYDCKMDDSHRSVRGESKTLNGTLHRA